jgi:hypothetical protein
LLVGIAGENLAESVPESWGGRCEQILNQFTPLFSVNKLNVSPPYELPF